MFIPDIKSDWRDFAREVADYDFIGLESEELSNRYRGLEVEWVGTVMRSRLNKATAKGFAMHMPRVVHAKTRHQESLSASYLFLRIDEHDAAQWQGVRVGDEICFRTIIGHPYNGDTCVEMDRDSDPGRVRLAVSVFDGLLVRVLAKSIYYGLP